MTLMHCEVCRPQSKCFKWKIWCITLHLIIYKCRHTLFCFVQWELQDPHCLLSVTSVALSTISYKEMGKPNILSPPLSWVLSFLQRVCVKQFVKHQVTTQPLLKEWATLPPCSSSLKGQCLSDLSLCAPICPRDEIWVSSLRAGTMS
jgi:hypothetical protein